MTVATSSTISAAPRKEPRAKSETRTNRRTDARRKYLLAPPADFIRTCYARALIMPPPPRPPNTWGNRDDGRAVERGATKRT
jgi:hypothetical protein